MNLKEKISRIPVHITIAITHIIILIIIVLIFYPLIPMLLNYPPDSINNDFQIQVAGLKYSTQYIGLAAIIIIGAAISLCCVLKKTEYDSSKSGNRKAIRKRCMEYPYKIYLYEMIIPSVLVLLALLLIKTEVLLAVRIMIIFLSAITALCVTALIVSKVMYEKMLAETYIENADGEPEGKRVGLTSSIIMQIFPILVFSILITSLIGYSRILLEKGDMLFEAKKSSIQELKTAIDGKNIEEIKKLYKTNDEIFIYAENGEKIVGSNDISEFFEQYLLQLSKQHDGRTYEYYGSNIQAVSEEISINGGNYFIGVRYAVTSNNTIIYFLIGFIILLIFNFLASWSISHSISYEIERISDRLKRIAKQEDIEQTSKLPITTNNEISDLVGSFNMILDLEKEQIEEIKNSQNALIEQERLATLGQLAGGMAHDINTPLSTISTGVDYFSMKLEKDEDSQKMFQVVKKSIEKISVIVNSVRDQIRELGTEKFENFKLSKVIENIEIILFSELKRNNCRLELTVEDDIEIGGDRGKLEQVITNIILNSVQAYENNGGNIKVNISAENDNAVIRVEDNAGGIPSEIAESLLKQIVSTKGSRGTGFGLYFSNSIIKGIFNGEIKFETEIGKGTKFYVVIPINIKEE